MEQILAFPEIRDANFRSKSEATLQMERKFAYEARVPMIQATKPQPGINSLKQISLSHLTAKQIPQ